jgi:outer membrane protein assembly factor BamD
MKRLALAFLVALVAACSTSKVKEQAFLDSVGQMSKEEVMAKGDALAAEGKREEARRYYSFISDSFPNDPLGRQAALKTADSYFAGKDAESLTEAQLRYKDFSNRFPNDPSRAYALLQLGKTYAKQRKGPLRDLTPAHQAVDALQQVVDQFPTSPYAQEARTLLRACQEDLALHELEVARYYVISKAWQGAYLRLTYLVATYPDSDAARKGKEMLVTVEAALARLHGVTPVPTATPAKPVASQNR